MQCLPGPLGGRCPSHHEFGSWLVPLGGVLSFDGQNSLPLLRYLYSMGSHQPDCRGDVGKDVQEGASRTGLDFLLAPARRPERPGSPRLALTAQSGGSCRERLEGGLGPIRPAFRPRLLLIGSP